MDRHTRMARWPAQRAWEWYKERPWIRGTNYIPSDCVNRIEQWQELDHDEKFETVNRELELAASAGFNAVRSILPFEVWREQRDGFLARLDRFLSIAHAHGIAVMIVLGNDCTVPKEHYIPPALGPQPVDWGYHGGTARSPHDILTSHGYSKLDEPATAEAFAQMVDEVIGRYAQDERVNIWDVFNEPGNSRRANRSLPHLHRFFEIGRAHNPIQPLTSGAWRVSPNRDLADIEQVALELSDVITFHDYGAYSRSVQIVDRLKQLGRPLLNTEWLHRIQRNNVASHLPLYYLERVGCYNWGLVAGRSQAYEPWEAIWKRHDAGTATAYDLTKWQHDLYRPNLGPYDPAEIEMMQEYFALADQRFASGDW